jgi:hypothetical protein
MARAHPDCTHDPAECRVSVTTSVAQPPIEWTPVYDGTGRMTNADPNTFVTTASCTVCDMAWEERRTGTETTIKTLPPAVTLPAE